MSIELDSTDRRILRLLQKDASLTTQEIAKQIGLSTTPTWRRINRLQDAGVIRGQVALLDHAALGLGETVFARITVDRHSKTLQDDFTAAIAAMPEVQSVHFLTGESDYLVKLAVSGTADYYDILVDRLYGLPGVQEVRSSFSLRTIKDTQSLPI